MIRESILDGSFDASQKRACRRARVEAGESADECLERRIGEEQRTSTESVPLRSGRLRSLREEGERRDEHE